MIYHRLADYYDQLMDFDYEAFLAVWQSLTDFEGQDIFEYGCGTGNMTARLLPLVRSIDAADTSPDMLMLARQKIQSPKLRFFLADEDFSIAKTYDKICLFVDVVNYLPPSQFERLLERWEHNLQPGGEILFDVSSEAKLSRVLGDQIYRYDIPEGEIYWINDYDETTKQLDFSLVIYREQADETFLREEEYHTQYVYTPDDIERLAKNYDITARLTPERDYYSLRKKK